MPYSFISPPKRLMVAPRFNEPLPLFQSDALIGTMPIVRRVDVHGAIKGKPWVFEIVLSDRLSFIVRCTRTEWAVNN